MSSKTLCRFVRFAALSTALCALIILLYILPSWGMTIVRVNPEQAGWYYPWLLFIWATSLPCFAILVLVWIVSGAIKREDVFTYATARYIRISAILLFCDMGFFFAGNVVFSILKMNHPGILLLSLIIIIFAISLGLLASVLARYITKAAVLQEESDGTI